jgi:DNA repair protein RadC
MAFGCLSSFVIHSIYLPATPLFFLSLRGFGRHHSFPNLKIESMATNKHEIELMNRTTVSDVKLIYSPKMKASERPMVTRSQEVHRVFMDTWDLNNLHFIEEFKLMLLNRGNRVLGVVAISSGGLTGTVADPRVILRYALLSGATAIALAHNHPSGHTNPSHADEAITQKIKQAAQLIDVQVVDHIILTGEQYLSMADEGLL